MYPFTYIVLFLMAVLAVVAFVVVPRLPQDRRQTARIVSVLGFALLFALLMSQFFILDM
jgi:hypothetical protein